MTLEQLSLNKIILEKSTYKMCVCVCVCVCMYIYCNLAPDWTTIYQPQSQLTPKKSIKKKKKKKKKKEQVFSSVEQIKNAFSIKY